MMTVALLTLALIWVGFIAYVVLGGADFGAGMWDLFASGPTARRQHQFITRVLGPVWEANHVWLIFLLVGLMNAFPAACSAFMTALFVPLIVALIGIVLRGSGFVFRSFAPRDEGLSARLWSRVFSTSSLLTPFFLGAAAAAVAGGRVRVVGVTPTDMLFAWITPFSVAVGVMAVLQCATLAAVYLAAEASRHGEQAFAEAYRVKALVSGVLTSAAGLLSIGLSVTQAPWLWRGMLVDALPVAIATVGTGTLVLVFLAAKRYHMASLFVILETALMLITWGISQYPYIIPTSLTIEQAANAPQVISTLLIVMAIGMLILLPALLFLFIVFKWTPATPAVDEQAEGMREVDTTL